MRLLIQRVSHAKVEVGSRTVGSIGNGALVFLGVAHSDTTNESSYTITGHKFGFGPTRKLSRFGDRKRVNIRNMNVVNDRRIPRLWRGRNSKFLAGCGMSRNKTRSSPHVS